MSTPTPRTDAVQFKDRSDYHDPSAVDWFVRAEHARTLERELAAERGKVKALERENTALKRQIEIDYWPLA